MVLDQLTNPEWHVLEIGPGGHPTPWSGPYTSIDVTPVGGTGIYGSEVGHRNTATHQGRMRQLPFEDDTFDAVIARHVLEHEADTLGALGAAWRVLKNRGLLLIVTPDQEDYPGNTIKLDPTHEACFTPRQLQLLVAHVGFVMVDVQRCVPNWSFFLKATKFIAPVE